MGHFMRVLAGGGAATFLLTFTLFYACSPTPVGAQEIMERGVVQTYLTAGGVGGFVILLLGLGIVVTTIAGIAVSRKEGRWPHWRALVMGLGEAAFLVGIVASFGGLIQAFQTIAQLGAAVTPADLADGFSTAMVTVYLGGIVALGGLGGAGLLRLLERPPADPVAAF